MTPWPVLKGCLLVGLVSTMTTASLTLTLLSGSSNRSFVQIEFNGEDIEKLYACMSSIVSLTCTADLNAKGKHRNESSHKTILDIDRTTIHGSVGAFSNIFICSLGSRNEKLTCSRQLRDIACDARGHLQMFQLLNTSTKNAPCTGLQLNNIEEKLVYNSTEYEFLTCDSPCSLTNPISSNVKPRHASQLRNREMEMGGNDWKTNEPIHVDDENHALVNPHPDDESQEEDDYDHGDDNDDGRDKSHIIIAAVASIVLIAGLILGGFTFRRQVMKLRKDSNSIEGDGKEPSAATLSAGVNSNNELSIVTISTSEHRKDTFSDTDNSQDCTDTKLKSSILSNQYVDSVI